MSCAYPPMLLWRAYAVNHIFALQWNRQNGFNQKIISFIAKRGEQPSFVWWEWHCLILSQIKVVISRSKKAYLSHEATLFFFAKVEQINWDLDCWLCGVYKNMRRFSKASNFNRSINSVIDCVTTFLSGIIITWARKEWKT